jgi:ABC-2 type transport system ATP-binding protein
VLLTSHYLEEIEALAERVVVIDHGRVLIDDTLDRVRSRVRVRRVRYGLAGDERAHRDGVVIEQLTDDADALVRDLVHRGVPFRELEVAAASLEDAFLTLTDAARSERR